MEQLELCWHGHACFSLTCRDFTIVFDPYEDNYIPGFSPLNLAADLVLCSHQHRDHNAVQVIQPLTGHENPFRISTLETFHDSEHGQLRGKNTIHLLESKHLRAAHLGDIGHALTPAQLAELRDLDLVMIPVGGFYTIGPQEAKAIIDAIRPKVVVPMHYRTGQVGLPAVAELDDFLTLVKDYTYYPGNSITINQGTKPQIAVLTYQG